MNAMKIFRTSSILILSILFAGLFFFTYNSNTKPESNQKESDETGYSVDETMYYAGDESVSEVIGFWDGEDNFESKSEGESESERQRQREPQYAKPTIPIYEETSVLSRTFEINTNKEAVVLGDKGTLLAFPRHCFVDENGKKVKGKVNIELKEVFSLADILLSNVPTISDGRILETNGAFYINAYQDGKELEIADGKSIYVEIPTDNKLNNMMLFTGEFNERGDINWVVGGKLSKMMYTLPFNTDIEVGDHQAVTGI